MQLYLVRHGKAEVGTGDDHERRLTPDGAKRIETEAQVIRKLGVQPARIFSSPRVRARQTAEIIASALGMGIEIDEAVNFGFNVSAVATLTESLPPDSQVMFVGHNPSMSDVTQALTGANVDLKVGGLARVDVLFPAPPLQGQLVWLLAPRVFEAL
jgi:phosphohistidine phosphatase